MHPIRNTFLWVVGLCVLLIITGKIPKSELDWQIVCVGAILFWLCAGLLFVARWLYHFVRGAS
jgi:hypothetical protein